MQSLGSWDTYTSNISNEAGAAFEEALIGLVGVRYTPVAVTQQVVDGMNYSFFCNAKGVYLDSQPAGAIINIYKKAGEKATISKIKIIDH